MIDTSMLPFPKPGHAAGRVVMSGSAYTRNKQRLWHNQGYMCARGPHPLASAADGHFHHTKKRGMGGGNRDDRFGELLCADCHLIEEGQKQIAAIAVIAAESPESEEAA